MMNYKSLNIILILICLFLNSCGDNDNCRSCWKVFSKDKNAIVLDYSVDTEMAFNYFEKNKPTCVKSGWIVCDYIKSAKIEFRRNGEAKVHHVEFNSDFTGDVPVIKRWHLKNDLVIIENMSLLFPLNVNSVGWFDSGSD